MFNFSASTALSILKNEANIFLRVVRNEMR
jgi:hypothetical protein